MRTCNQETLPASAFVSFTLTRVSGVLVLVLVLARTLFSALDRQAAVLEVATLQSVRPVTEFARA